MIYKGINIDDISLFKHPAIYFMLLIQVIQDMLKWIVKFVGKNIVLVIILIIIGVAINTIESLYTIKSILFFMGYWIILGVASSIGLGTGLHTFVLYLGPHIAQLAIVATNCGYIPKMLPSRWQFDHFQVCQKNQSETISFLGILLAVQIQSFLWGFGTALGELPPYFVALKAAKTRHQLQLMKKNKKLSENQEQLKKLVNQQDKKEDQQAINQIMQLKKKSNLTFIEKVKILIYDHLQRYEFITILLCASIPNPLFDLAGITCGHFRIPFKVFFTATFIGKAIIKVHIQMLFVITVFRKQTFQWVLQKLGTIHEGIRDIVKNAMDKQRQVLHAPSVSQQKPLIGRLWDIFIMLMISYFIFSIVNGLVKQKAIQLTNKETQRSK